MKPHTCPRCNGRKQTAGEPCPTCSATGVVWEQTAEEAAEQTASEDHLDLTYRP